MSPRTPGRPGRRSLIAIPAVAVPAAIVAAVLVPLSAAGAVDLPDKSPAELIAFAEASTVDEFSGSLTQTSALGLPDLAALGSDGSGASAPGEGKRVGIDELVALATGSYSARVYRDGDRARLQVLDRLAERNVYVDASDREGWFVDSETKSATRVVLTGDADAPAATPTPESVLDDALASLDATTEVTVGTDARVAGRDAYELILTPRDPGTLIGSIRFAVDGENGAALAASVTTRGETDPAVDLAFTQITFSAPDPADLVFTPGADTTVRTKDIALPTGPSASDPEPPAGPRPVVTGEGWTRVVELPASEDGSLLDGLTADQRGMLDGVTTAVAGGRVLTTALVTVLLTDDGRVFAGAVPADRLVEVAASGR